jgi:hypothetical protein
VSEGSEITHELRNHDERPWCCFGQPKTVYHLLGLNPSVMTHRLLTYIGEHGIRSSESHHGSLAEEYSDIDKYGRPSSPQTEKD